MTILISVRNFRGVKQADFACAPLAWISGLNSMGKSSIAQAVAAALTGGAIEASFELKKADIKDLIRDGSQKATVKLSVDGGEVVMTYPEGRLEVAGPNAPTASIYAAGLESLATTPLKERPKLLSAYIKADPSETDLLAELGDEFDTDIVKACWAAIQKNGWDKTLENTEHRRTNARAAWEQVTGESFGSSKIKSWRPQGWTDDIFASADIEQLEEEVREAKATLETAIGNQAVDAAEMSRLQAAADEHADRTVAAERAREILAALNDELDKAKQEAINMPRAVDAQHQQGMLCPHCSKSVSLHSSNGKVELVPTAPPQQINDAENKERRLAKAAIDGKISNLTPRVSQAQRDLNAAAARLEEAEGALAQLELGAGAGDKVSGEVVVRARTHLADVETGLVMARKYAQATEAAERWQANDRFVSVLSAGPSGLRTKKLVEAIAAFNSAVLSPLCDIAEWATVEVTEDFRVTVAGRVYSLLADSDQMRARIILQIAMAKLDGSAMVVIDRAEALDSANKLALVNLLMESEMPALVCMVAGKPEQVPDLSKADCGITMWVQDGIAKPLSEVLMAKAA